jgi:putative lipoprotein (rSAM/lipoprotein system)
MGLFRCMVYLPLKWEQNKTLKMKARFFKFYDKLIMALIGLFPFFSGCDDNREEYGCPNADYILRGTVTDSLTNNPVSNIRVSLLQDTIHQIFGDSTLTDADGKYTFLFNEMPYETITFKLLLQDIDGDSNGGSFLSEDVDVNITEDNWHYVNQNWYVGEAIKDTDIKLNK